MNHSGWLATILGVFGVPPGEDPAFYRDVVLGTVFAFASLICVVKLLDHSVDAKFWAAAFLASISFISARSKSGLLLGFALLAAVRLMFAWVTH